MYPNTVLNLTICDTDVFIIGEHAKSSASGELCVDVIEEEDPDLLCIESCPEKFEFYRGTGYQSTVGTFAAEQYCRETDTELFLLDVLQSEASLELQLLPDKDTIEQDRPTFNTDQITENGGVKSQEYIESYVEQNKEYDEKRFEFIWETRENFMANSLLQKLQSDEFDVAVMIVGLSHIYRIKKLLSAIDVDTISVDETFLSERSFTLEFANLLDKRDEESFYE